MSEEEPDHGRNSHCLEWEERQSVADDIDSNAVASLRDKFLQRHDRSAADLVAFYQHLKAAGHEMSGERWDAFVETARAEEKRQAARKKAGEAGHHQHWIDICKSWGHDVVDYYDWTRPNLGQTKMKVLKECASKLQPFEKFVSRYGLVVFLEHRQAVMKTTSRRNKFAGRPGDLSLQNLRIVKGLTDTPQEVHGEFITDTSAPQWWEEIRRWVTAQDGSLMVNGRRLDYWRSIGSSMEYLLELDKYGMLMPRQSDEGPRSSKLPETGFATPPTSIRRTKRLQPPDGGVQSCEEEDAVESGAQTPVNDVEHLAKEGDVSAIEHVTYEGGTYTPSVHALSSASTLLGSASSRASAVRNIAPPERRSLSRESESPDGGLFLPQDHTDGQTSAVDVAEGGGLGEPWADETWLGDITPRSEVLRHIADEDMPSDSMMGEESARLVTEETRSGNTGVSRLPGDEMAGEEMSVSRPSSQDMFGIDAADMATSSDGAMEAALLGGDVDDEEMFADEPAVELSGEATTVDISLDEPVVVDFEDENGDTFEDLVAVDRMSTDGLGADEILTNMVGDGMPEITHEEMSPDGMVEGMTRVSTPRKDMSHIHDQHSHYYFDVDNDESADACSDPGDGWNEAMYSGSRTPESANTLPSPRTPPQVLNDGTEDGHSLGWPTASTRSSGEWSPIYAFSSPAIGGLGPPSPASPLPLRPGRDILSMLPTRDIELSAAPNSHSTSTGATQPTSHVEIRPLTRTEVRASGRTERIATADPQSHIFARSPATHIETRRPVKHIGQHGGATARTPVRLTVNSPIPEGDLRMEEIFYRRHRPQIQELLRTVEEEATAPAASPQCVTRWRWLSNVAFATAAPLSSDYATRRGIWVPENEADVYHCSDLEFIQAVKGGMKFTKPVVIKERSGEAHLHTVGSLVDGLRDGYEGTEVEVQSVRDEQKRKLPMSDFLDLIRSGEEPVAPVDLYNKFHAHEPTFTLLTRFMSLYSALARMRERADVGDGTVPTFHGSRTLSLSRLETNGAFSGPHVGALGMNWTKILAGTRLFMFVPPEAMAEEWEAFARDGPKWRPDGKQLLIAVERGDVVLTPRSTVFARCAMGICAEMEGPVWDDLDILGCLQSARWAEENPHCATGVPLRRLPGVLRSLTDLVRQRAGRFGGEGRGSLFSERFQEEVSALERFSGENDSRTGGGRQTDVDSYTSDPASLTTGHDAVVDLPLEKRPRIH